MHQQDLLTDESFINYCTGRDSQSINYWESHLINHPEEKEMIEELKAIVLLTCRSIKNIEIQSQFKKLEQRIK